MINHGNIYNILFEEPALKKWQMSPDLEMLARQVVLSGRMRIDADERCNFTRFSIPSYKVNLAFSYRELVDSNLIMRTKQIIYAALSKKYRNKEKLEARVDSEIERLRHDVEKIVGVDVKTEIMLARAIVQSSHPASILLMLAEGAELFISYDYTVGDMLDIQSWQEVGSSSGLQSSDHTGTAVFISCDGDPERKGEYSRHSGDGFAAIARLMVIAGQEIGHFSDIIRDKKGRRISRHAADLSGSRAKRKVKVARITDIKNMQAIEKQLARMQIRRLYKYERDIAFFKEQKRRGFIVLNTKRKINNLSRSLVRKCRKVGLGMIADIQKDDAGYIGANIAKMVMDMKFNLEPKADAYERDDPDEEEAIACIEALARVPQQVNKWGHDITARAMPNLYKIYYEEVIPDCIRAYEQIAEMPYDFKVRKKGSLIALWQRLLRK